jgi:hypothetical protein
MRFFFKLELKTPEQGPVISRSVATDVTRYSARWLDWVLQSGRRRRLLSNSAVMSGLADPESGFRIQMDVLYKVNPAGEVFVYLIHENHSVLAN